MLSSRLDNHWLHIPLISPPNSHHIYLTSPLLISLSNHTFFLLFVTQKYLPNFLWLLWLLLLLWLLSIYFLARFTSYFIEFNTCYHYWTNHYLLWFTTTCTYVRTNIISGTARGRKFQKKKHREPIEMKCLWFDVTQLLEELYHAFDWLPDHPISLINHPTIWLTNEQTNERTN